jgi:hypothetical protein
MARRARRPGESAAWVRARIVESTASGPSLTAYGNNPYNGCWCSQQRLMN